MPEVVLATEPYIRLTAFGTVLVLMALLELAAPRRPQTHGRLSRWPSNLSLVAISALCVKLVFPVSAIWLATWLAINGYGVLNVIQLPGWLAVVVTVALLDLVIYLQHMAFHHVPVLWRLHRMHHADLEFDVSTGIRFHPVEIVLSMAIKLAAVAVLGAPALGVLLFEILLNGTALFNHSNVKLPLGLDLGLRWLVVTPDMHRVHHSIEAVETHSNFGFSLPWWDRLFGTYRDQPAAGHDGMIIGLPVFRDPSELRLDKLLTQPWRRSTSAMD